MTSSEQRRVDLLEWLYRYNGYANFAAFLGIPPRPMIVPPWETEAWDNTWSRVVTEWSGTLRELQRQGLIEVSLLESDDFQNTMPRITDTGRNEVEVRRAHQAAEQKLQQIRRVDPALRRAAAARGLLRWLYEQDPDGMRWLPVDQVLKSEHVKHEGEQLPEGVIRRAARFLQDNQLIRGDGCAAEVEGPLTVQITKQGQDCVEEGATVADYLRKKNEGTTNITNFHAPVSGNIALHSTHVTQTATTTGLAGDEIGALVRALVEALPALGLPDEQATTVRSNAEVIEGELARKEQDPHIVKTMMRRTLEALTGATSSTLGLLLTGYAKELMRNAGIPID